MIIKELIRKWVSVRLSKFRQGDGRHNQYLSKAVDKEVPQETPRPSSVMAKSITRASGGQVSKQLSKGPAERSSQAHY